MSSKERKKEITLLMLCRYIRVPDKEKENRDTWMYAPMAPVFPNPSSVSKP